MGLGEKRRSEDLGDVDRVAPGVTIERAFLDE
jgi:hypothetical protein